MTRRALVPAACALLLGACAITPPDYHTEPHLTPVGTGLQADVAAYSGYRFPAPPRTGSGSLWDEDRANLFRDPRAMRVGDVLTVNIDIDDKATLDNTSGRSTTSTIGNSSDFFVGVGSSPTKNTIGLDVNSKSAAKGQGNVDRSEKIHLAVAAVVTGVLPDGNLLVSGSQEVRVNYELRLLNVAGIVRPRDISKENTIGYQKIAEARISYGGRGRVSDAQQPGWGHELYDFIKPF